MKLKKALFCIFLIFIEMRNSMGETNLKIANLDNKNLRTDFHR